MQPEGRKDFTTKTFVAKKRHHKYSLLTAGVSRLVVESLSQAEANQRRADGFGVLVHYVLVLVVHSGKKTAVVLESMGTSDDMIDEDGLTRCRSKNTPNAHAIVLR